MRRPSLQTFVFGHPLVLLPIELGGCFVLYACWQHGGDGVIPGVVMLAAMGEALRANEQVTVYKRWKLAWDSFDNEPRRRMGICLRLGFVLAGLWTTLIAITAVASSTKPDALAAVWAVGWPVAFIVPFAIALLLKVIAWIFRRRSRGKDAGYVKVVARCIVPPLTLGAAFDALPEHCQRILQRTEGA